MPTRTVSVFGASGRQGQAQVRRLLAAGHRVRAVSRHPDIFSRPEFAGTQVTPANYADPASLDDVCRGTEGVFFQPPRDAPPGAVLEYTDNLCAAAERAGIRSFVLNTTMWAPDEPCGQPIYDQALAIENICAATKLPLVVFRPTVYMDNWLTALAKPVLVREHKYRYSHKPDLRLSPISLNDVAKFMTVALDRPDLVGQRIRIAGPETLTPPRIAEILTSMMRVRIDYEYITPRQNWYDLDEAVGSASG